jgi:hypothetical protein
MTPNEITTAIALKYNKVLDMPFKLALMERVNAWRSRAIRNSLERNSKDRKFFIQTIYVKMHKEKEYECDLPVTLCDVAVSEIIPAPLRANGVSFDFVGAINGSNPFYEVGPGMAQYLRKGKYTGNRMMYDWINDRLVVMGNPELPMIRIDAIWDDPLAISDFLCKPASTPGDADCDFWNQEYPATREIIQQIIQMIEQVDFKDKNTVNLEEDIQVPVNPKTDN